MKAAKISGLMLLSIVASASAERTYSAFVREITIESINSAPADPSQWVQTQHDSITISDQDTEPVLGDLVSTYSIGKGLWFGLYAENSSGDIELVASRIIGAQPSAAITVTSLDTASNAGGVYTEPITRADIPFTVSIDVTNISDDSLLQQTSNGVDVVEDLVTFTEYPPATKYMKLTRHVEVPDESDSSVQIETLTDTAYTHGAGQVFLTRTDDSADVTAQSYSDTQVLSELSVGVTDYTSVSGREIYKAHVVPDYSWDGSNIEGTTFIENEAVSIRVLPTAYADDPVDANDRPVQGELYFSLPNIEWAVKQLYPRSETRIALYTGSVSGAAVAYSDTYLNPSNDNIQDYPLVWDLQQEGSVVDQDGITYTAVIETKTPMDLDGNGSADDWEELGRVSFSYNRVININAVIVSGE
ncbi:hypothetical protein [Rubritalea sp.]|uniref:hypothetical protein n=1 Tax=Rubritalea sp. TaxID=2109375 RepID=UPI003EF76817